MKLPVDRETGEQRPYAFIAFKHPISGTCIGKLLEHSKWNSSKVYGSGSQKVELVLEAGHISTGCGAVPVSTRQFSLFLDTALATFLHLMIVPRRLIEIYI